jgi:hypothetical protein
MQTQPWANWFDLNHCGGRESCRQLPAECVADCSGPGPADDAVAFWLERLQFDGPPWLFRQHLREFGAWDSADLADHNANRARVLWIWACDCREDPGAHDFLWLGT